MTNNIEKILSELYEINPDLRTQELRIRTILEKLIGENPQIAIDGSFQKELRKRLESDLRQKKVSIFRKPIPRIILATAASAALLALVFLPRYAPGTGQLKESAMKMESVEIATNEMQMESMTMADDGESAPLMERSEMRAVEGVLNTEEYDRIYENSFLNAMENPLSTFSIDVDTASYANIRRFLNNGTMPYPDAVRIEELINYFPYDYKSPEDESPLSIETELSYAPWKEENLLLKIGLQGKKISFDRLPPSNLVFLLDVSGSMNDPDKLPLLKNALKMIVNNMRNEDYISIVVYAGAAGTVLEPTNGENRQEILKALDRLEAGGSTAGAQGINLAYEIAMENYRETGNNRIILATDGDFNVGVSSDSELERLIEKKRDMGIYLTVLGFGTGNYKDSKMEKIADRGNGNYAYIDSLSEARKVLVNEMGGTFYTIAEDVKIQIEFNPAYVESYRLIGYENRLLAKEDFDDDTKDAGELGSGHSVTALYEIVPAKEISSENALKYQSAQIKEDALLSNELMTIDLRYKNPDSDKSILLETTVNNIVTDIENTSDDFRFAASVAQWGMLLRNSAYKGNSTYEQVILRARNSRGADEEGYRSEFIHLVEISRELSD